MPHKTITITEDVYDILVRMKLPNESFSEQIRRLTEKKGKISECAGLWARWMTKKQMDDISNTIKECRRQSARAKAEKARFLRRAGHNVHPRPKNGDAVNEQNTAFKKAVNSSETMVDKPEK